MFKIIVAAAIAALATVSPASAKDSLVEGCAPFATALRMAMDGYGEAPAYIAESGNLVITVTINPKTGTFSLWAQKEFLDDVPRRRRNRLGARFRSDQDGGTSG